MGNYVDVKFRFTCEPERIPRLEKLIKRYMGDVGKNDICIGNSYYLDTEMHRFGANCVEITGSVKWDLPRFDIVLFFGQINKVIEITTLMEVYMLGWDESFFIKCTYSSKVMKTCWLENNDPIPEEANEAIDLLDNKDAKIEQTMDFSRRMCGKRWNNFVRKLFLIEMLQPGDTIESITKKYNKLVNDPFYKNMKLCELRPLVNCQHKRFISMLRMTTFFMHPELVVPVFYFEAVIIPWLYSQYFVKVSFDAKTYIKECASQIEFIKTPNNTMWVDAVDDPMFDDKRESALTCMNNCSYRRYTPLWMKSPNGRSIRCYNQ